MGKEELVKVTIDDQAIKVPKGTTLLKAAKKLGIDIPTLCFHESLPPQGSCRLCVVEITDKTGKWTWIDASCVYPASEGLSVKTNSPSVVKHRKTIIELLLSKAPNAEILLNLAEKYGASKTRYTAIDQGESNCILCALCVRTCNEIIGSHAIGTAERGVHKKVISPFNIAGDNCIGCTACIHVCPTGAIKSKIGKESFEIEDWGVNLKMATCSSCKKPFATAVHLEKLKSQVNLKNQLWEMCPECRRSANKVGTSYSPII